MSMWSELVSLISDPQMSHCALSSAHNVRQGISRQESSTQTPSSIRHGSRQEPEEPDKELTASARPQNAPQCGFTGGADLQSVSSVLGRRGRLTVRIDF